MANKLALSYNGSPKEIKFGNTFNKGYKDESYHTIRYDFKPASVDSHKTGTLDVVDKEVTLTIPTEGVGASQAAVFKGNKTPASKDCLLIIDHDTGEFVLERILENIRVKKTRIEGSSKKVIPRVIPPTEKKPRKVSPSTNSSKLPPPSAKKSPKKSPKKSSHKESSVPSSSSGSMPMLGFEEEIKNDIIMSDSSSDSNSDSTSSSDSDSDSESNSQDGAKGATAALPKVKSPSSILSDLELSEED